MVKAKKKEKKKKKLSSGLCRLTLCWATSQMFNQALYSSGPLLSAYAEPKDQLEAFSLLSFFSEDA